jgi:hypothetical protein
VTFSSIPQSYTDLVVVFNARSDRNDQANRPTDLIRVTFNGSSAAYYSDVVLGSNSSSVYSYKETNQAFMAVGAVPGAQSNAGEYGTNIFHIQSYSNTTTFKALLARGGNATSVGSGNYYMGLMAGLWRGSTGSSKEAITSITLAPYVGPNFVAGSTFSIYGIAAGDFTTKAAGGDVTVSGGYAYHVFKTSGLFTPYETLTTDILVVGGGGGGGKNVGAGGGAGGLQTFASQSLAVSDYQILVGAGGVGGGPSDVNGFSGSTSALISLTPSYGGGGGGGAAAAQGLNGGSGGGSSFPGPGIAGGLGVAGQGNNGGSSIYFVAGGGGGAGAAGANATGSGSGAGGIGGTSALINTLAAATSTGVYSAPNYYFAGGGGGGGYIPQTDGAGGIGGGGAGGGTPTAGTENTGGGGGGNAGGSGYGPNGASGGSGIVIIRYAV